LIPLLFRKILHVKLALSRRMTVYDVYDTGNLGEMTVYVTLAISRRIKVYIMPAISRRIRV
jgi:hypothetical protein